MHWQQVLWGNTSAGVIRPVLNGSKRLRHAAFHSSIPRPVQPPLLRRFGGSGISLKSQLYAPRKTFWKRYHGENRKGPTFGREALKRVISFRKANRCPLLVRHFFGGALQGDDWVHWV